MTQDLYQNIREQLSQAIQEQAVLVQEKAIQASHDFIHSMIDLANIPAKTKEEVDEIAQGILNLGEADSFCCGDIEYHTHYLDGIIPVYTPYEEDEEIENDEYVIEAIIEREEHELLDEIEGDKESIDYFSEHSNALSDKS
jgi:hypothetical protein